MLGGMSTERQGIFKSLVLPLVPHSVRSTFMQMMIPIAAQCVILSSVVMIVKYLAYYFTLCLILTIGSGLRFFVSLKKNTKEE